MNILQLKKMKQEQQKITMITCYDYCLAHILKNTPVDCILVGDSAAMIMHGFENTIPADIHMIAAHARSFRRKTQSINYCRYAIFIVLH